MSAESVTVKMCRVPGVLRPDQFFFRPALVFQDMLGETAAVGRQCVLAGSRRACWAAGCRQSSHVGNAGTIGQRLFLHKQTQPRSTECRRNQHESDCSACLCRRCYSPRSRTLSALFLSLSRARALSLPLSLTLPPLLRLYGWSQRDGADARGGG